MTIRRSCGLHARPNDAAELAAQLAQSRRSSQYRIRKRSIFSRLCARISNIYPSAGRLRSTSNMKNFHPDCTLPSEPGFVSAPNARGTLSIVWSCFSVLILCTWSIQHPNLPIQFRRQTTRQTIRHQLHQASRKVMSMCLAIIAPEFYAAIAVEELVFASQFTKKFRNAEVVRDKSLAQWSLTHTFLAQMGGFQIRFPHLPLVETTQLGLSETNGGFQSHVLNHPLLQRSESLESGSTDGESMPLQPIVAHEEPPMPHTILPGEMLLPYDDAHPRSDATSYATSLHHASLDIERGFNQASVPSKPPTQSIPTPSKGLLHEEATAWLSNEAIARDIVNPATLAGDLSRKYGHFFWNPVFQVEVSDAMKDPGMTPLDNYQAQTALFLQGDAWVLDAAQFLKAHEIGLIANLPDITEEELKDKSKSDVLVKALALAQGIWLITQVISRSVWTPSLHCSQLEIGTIAVALCMLPIYIAFWKKPQNVSTAIVVHASRAPTKDDITIIAVEERSSLRQYSFYIPSGGTNTGHIQVPHLGDMYVSTPLLTVFGSLLGAVHFAAWNYTFPTPTENMLWKIATCITTGMPVVFSGVAHNTTDHGTLISWLLLFGGMAVYSIARLFIVVEMFRCLYYLPPNAYVATWASEIPSIA